MFTIGQIIKVFRKCKGMTQTELANRLNITQSTISKIESDEISPTVKFLDDLSEVLGLEAFFMLELRHEDSLEKVNHKVTVELEWLEED